MRKLLWTETVAIVFFVTTVSYGMLVSPGSVPESSDFTYFDNSTKWDPGADIASVHGFTPPNGPMTPGGATFSIMGAGLTDAYGIDTDHSTPTADITALGVSGYTAADYAADIDAALNVWASVSMFTNLGQVSDSGTNAGASNSFGDIRVAAWGIDTVGAIAHAYQPGTEAIFGLGGTIGGDMHFDVDFTWVDDPFDVTGNGQFDFFTITLHELGHSLGLGHSDTLNSVMYPFYNGANRTLYADDIAGIQALYGVPEPTTMALLGLGAVALLKRKK